MKKKEFEIAVIFSKKIGKNKIINYFPHHIALGHKDETTGDFITRKGNHYSYMLNPKEKFGYGLRQTVILKKENSEKPTLHPLAYLKEYALTYFDLIKYNEYRFIIPKVGDYENVQLALKNPTNNQYTYIEERDLILAKKFLKKDELFDAKKLTEELKAKIIGQDKAIDDIVSILWQNSRGEIKNNILLIGPTGVGKTEIIRNITQKLNIPIVTTDATSLIATGYVGQNIENILFQLIQEANNDLSRASRGIIFIDEIDKKASKNEEGRNAELGTVGVQDELLKLLEDGNYQINLGSNAFPNFVNINTKNITIIASGAFTELQENKIKAKKKIGFNQENIAPTKTIPITTEDLYKFGLKKELVGRLHNIIELNPLTEKDFIEILKNPHNKTIEAKRNLLEYLGIKLQIDEEIYEELAKDAISKKVGARGLIGSVDNLFKEPMFEISQDPSFYSSLIIKKKSPQNPKGYLLEKKK